MRRNWRVLVAVALVSFLGCAGEPPRAASVSASSDPIAAAARALVATGCDAPGDPSPPVPTWRAPSPAEGAFDVVVYTAHPDDEAMYAGGTMARLVHAGRKVAFVSASHGEGGRVLERDASGALVTRRDYARPRVVALRDREMADAARAIGVDSAHLYPGEANLDDAFTESCTEALRHWDTSVPGGVAGMLRRLVDDLGKRRPRIVITLDPRDDPQASHHGHHKAIGVLAELAARLSPHVVEELLTTAPKDAKADVIVRADVAARLSMLGAYRSQFVPEELAADPIAQRPADSFVLRWRAIGAPKVTTSRLAEMLPE